MAHKLPVEVVTHIMRFLPVSDRKEMALVCRSWYEASIDPILQKDVVVHFYANMSADSQTCISVLRHRKLAHMVINYMDKTVTSISVVDSSECLAENLKSLSLKGSTITETSFVKLLSRCTNLTSLDVSCCNSLFMAGTLLQDNDSLQKLKSSLKNVKELNLSSLRHLSDATFNRVATVCENVEKLHLASAKFVFSEVGSYKTRNISRCANGTVLTFSNIVEYVSIQGSKLTALNLSRTSIEDSHLDELVTIQELHLQEINISSCRNLTDEGVATLCESQKGLVSLDIGDNYDLTTGSLFKITENLSQLQSLNISKLNQVQERGISFLTRLKKLNTLTMTENYNATCESICKGLCSKSNILTHLSLRGCWQVGDASVEMLSESQPFLVHLDLGSCRAVSDTGVKGIVKNLKHLRYLSLAWCPNITDLGLLGLEMKEDTNYSEHFNNCSCFKAKLPRDGLKFNNKKLPEISVPTACVVKHLFARQPGTIMLSNLKLLRHLDLSECNKLTDVCCAEGVKFKELRSLHLSGHTYLTDESMSTVARNNPSIEELDISGCTHLTDISMETVVQKLPRLHTLNAKNCCLLTDQTVKLILAYCKRLKNLDLTYCSLITEQALSQLQNCHPTLQNLVNGTLESYIGFKC